MARNFFDFFPAPKFLEMPAPGLSISDTGIRLIEFKKEHNTLVLKQHAEALFPTGAIVSGEIKDSDALLKILEEFRREYKIEYIRTTLPEERTYLFRTKVLNPTSGDLQTNVEFVIEENVPISLSESVFDYNVISSTKNENGIEQLEVSISVIPQEVVSEYLELFRMAGFNPLHFEVESQAVSKAIVPNTENGSVFVININKEKAGIYVVSQGFVSFSSKIPIALPEEVNVPQSEIKYIPETSEGNDVSRESLTSNFVGLGPIVDEVKKIMLYLQTQADKENKSVDQIKKIYVCGEEGHRSGITEFLSENLKISAELGNVWVNAFSLHNFIPNIPLKKSLGYASAVGLALPRRDNT